ncbi:UNVERIFIED_CONTAM: Dipeptidyl aminopeptidase [Siphonaria sp. JEL0065]|nr:Dipeptidyl aminopeptidase [Siphonaria sp. JEL0065]
MTLTLKPADGYFNVETSGFDASDIEPTLQSRVDTYSALKPTNLLSFAKDPIGGIFIKQRAKREDGLNGKEVFRIVDNRVVTQVTDLCSGPENLGCNIFQWTSTTSGFIFLRDNGGNEAPDLWEGVLDVGDSHKWKFQPLISNTSSKVKCGGVCLSKDELTLLFTWNIRDNKCADVYSWKRATQTSSWKNTEPVLAYKSSGMFSPIEFSPDGQRVFFYEAFSASRVDLLVGELDVDGMISKPLVRVEYPGVDATKKDITFGSFAFSKMDPDLVYVETNAFGDVPGIVGISILDKTVIHVTTFGKQFGSVFPSKWEPEGIVVLEGDRLLFSLNEDGLSVTYLVNVWGRTVERVKTPIGVVSSIIINDGTNEVAYSVNSPSHPSMLYHFDSKTLESTPFRVGVSRLDGEVESASKEPELIRYTSFDGTEISAFLYLPLASKVTSKMPVLLYIHGGPASQYRPYYLPGNHPLSMRYLTDEMGIACIAPNIRGSSGYGTAFMEADDRLKRESALKDIECLAKWAQSDSRFDGERISIMGRSYGGWAVLASMVYYPDLFKCGLSTCGISNYLTFFQNTGPWRADHRRKEYGDERDPVEREFLERISPVLHAERIVSPLYLGIGENDTRVPLGEAVQMAEVVRAKEKTVWLLVGKKEGHVFEQKSVQDFHAVAQAAFLQKYLL